LPFTIQLQRYKINSTKQRNIVRGSSQNSVYITAEAEVSGRSPIRTNGI